MKDISAMAADINDQLSDIRPGSLQFFGDWFGRPHDNIHHIIRAEAQSGVLRLYFDGGETLDAWEPSGLAIRKEGFWVGGARKVRWEWFYYGRPHTQENRFFLEYQR